MSSSQSLESSLHLEVEAPAVRPAPDRAMPRKSCNRMIHARRLERVIRHMLARIDEPVTNEEMAEIACFSPCHFNRVFRNVTGIPPIQFHYALRLQKAKNLLIETDRLITEICFDVGYNSLGTFVTRFNELVGLPPNAFRRLARDLAPVHLSDFIGYFDEISEDCGVGIVGTIDQPLPCDGLTFSALFRRAIPAGKPVACAFSRTGERFVLPVPADGQWRIMSIAIPWSATGAEMFTLDALPRGRSGPIVVEGGRWTGNSTVALAMPNLLDPPILATLPLFISRMAGSERRRSDATWQSRWPRHATV